MSLSILCVCVRSVSLEVLPPKVCRDLPGRHLLVSDHDSLSLFFFIISLFVFVFGGP